MAANSIGLPDDIPTRALSALRQSDLVIFEEDRQARRSLKAAGIHRDYLRFSEHHELTTLEALEDCLRDGGTACYMSDQGMPVVADPGQQLLSTAYRLNAKVEVIPGPSSITAALAACPFLGSRFRYYGFLPREQENRLQELAKLTTEEDAIVFMDTPYRRQALLSDVKSAFGPERRALLALDISGPKEAFHFGLLSDLVKVEADKLNFVLVIDGKAPTRKSRRCRSKRRPTRQ